MVAKSNVPAGLGLVTGLRAQHGTFDFATINPLFDEHLPVVLAGGGDGGGQTILLGLAVIGFLDFGHTEAGACARRLDKQRISKTGVLDLGKHYTGVVKSLTSYGAFVDIGGVDGMVHISELSWSRIKHPSEVVKVGDTVEVYVISADKEKKKISLGMKDHSQDPWTVFTSQYQVGDVANVRVVKLMTFGAFAEIVPGVDGLIHISQIADHRIEKPGDVLAEGEKVDVKITDIDMENKKVSLSIRALLEEPEAEEDAPAEE